MLRTAWSRRNLRQQAEESAEIAADHRRRQVAAADGTATGDQESAQYRNWADQEEDRAARAAREADRSWVRMPVRPAPYIREGDRADRRRRREHRRGGGR